MQKGVYLLFFFPRCFDYAVLHLFIMVSLSLFQFPRPPDDDFLNTARVHRLKEVRMSEILKEIVTYFLFLMLLLLVAYGNRDPSTYLLRKTLHETFVDLDQLSVDLADVCISCLRFYYVRDNTWARVDLKYLFDSSTRYKVKHETRYSIFTSNHVLFCLLHRHTDNKVFDEFSEDYRSLSEDYRRFSKNCLKTTRTLNNFRRLPMISEDIV